MKTFAPHLNLALRNPKPSTRLINIPAKGTSNMDTGGQKTMFICGKNDFDKSLT
jgi:hypothetical protein